MKLSRSFRKLGRQLEEVADQATGNSRANGRVLRNVGWASAGLIAVTLGVVVGREIRDRYKFNRQTPYDFYAHSGDQVQDVEFGVGI